MSNLRRALACGALALLSACASPSPQQQAQDEELVALAPLKQTYSGIVSGFDFKDPNTLVVSIDLQSYIEMNDDDAISMKRAVVARWRDAWLQAHPKQHALLHVRFIDFIGRKIEDDTIKT